MILNKKSDYFSIYDQISSRNILLRRIYKDADMLISKKVSVMISTIIDNEIWEKIIIRQIEGPVYAEVRDA